MIKKIFNTDNFFFGALMGLVFPVLAYFLIEYIITLINGGNIEFALGSNRKQMYAIVANLIPFRIYMVNKHYDQTGIGLLFSTVIIVIVYFLIYLDKL